MPVTYKIDKAKKIVFAEATGELTVQDIRAYRRAAIAEPNFDPNFDHLFDFSAITGVRLTGDEIRALATGTIFSHQSRKAHLVAAKDMFGISRMFSILIDAQTNEMRVFEDMDEARLWLGLGPEPDQNK